MYPVNNADLMDELALIADKEDAMESYKLLCKKCHDNYGSDNAMFGVCCGETMVYVPLAVYDSVRSGGWSAINSLIKMEGIPAVGE